MPKPDAHEVRQLILDVARIEGERPAWRDHLLARAVRMLEQTLLPSERTVAPADLAMLEAVERPRPPLLSEMLLAEVERERRLLPLGHAFARSERAGADRDACTVVVGRDRVLHCFKPRALHEPLTVAPDGEVAQFAARLSEREAQAARGA